MAYGFHRIPVNCSLAYLANLVSDFGSQMGADRVSSGRILGQQPADQGHGRARCPLGCGARSAPPSGRAMQRFLHFRIAGLTREESGRETGRS